MMGETIDDNTVTVGAIEIESQTLRAMAEVIGDPDDDFKTGDGLSDAAIEDGYALVDDGWNNSEATLVDLETGASEYIWLDEVDFEEGQPFEDYLRDEVFTQGDYVFSTGDGQRDLFDVAVSEFDEGGGHIISNDLERAAEDDSVGVEGIQLSDGVLYLSDGRDN